MDCYWCDFFCLVITYILLLMVQLLIIANMGDAKTAAFTTDSVVTLGAVVLDVVFLTLGGLTAPLLSFC